MFVVSGTVLPSSAPTGPVVLELLEIDDVDLNVPILEGRQWGDENVKLRRERFTSLSWSLPPLGVSEEVEAQSDPSYQISRTT